MLSFLLRDLESNETCFYSFILSFLLDLVTSIDFLVGIIGSITGILSGLFSINGDYDYKFVELFILIFSFFGKSYYVCVN